MEGVMLPFLPESMGFIHQIQQCPTFFYRQEVFCNVGNNVPYFTRKSQETIYYSRTNPRSMLDFKRKSRELEKNLPVTVKNLHIMDLKEILRIGQFKWREIGWEEI